MAVPAAAEDEPFCPNNDRLVDRYLRAKIDGRMSDLANAAYFVDADVCSARSEELVRAHGIPARVPSRDAGDGQQWHFFCPARFLGSSLKKRSRTIAGTGDKESWHAEGRPKPVEGSAAGGYLQKFSYHVRTGPKIVDVEKPGWIMAEYTFKDTRDGGTVLCKIYRSPRGPGRSKAPSSSAKSGCKRKAATRNTRWRQTDEDEEDAAALFEGSNQHSMMSDEDHAAAPEFGEMLHVELSNPEPHFASVVWDGEFMRLMTAEDEDLFADNQQQDAAVQTAHGPLTYYDVTATVATGVTLDKLLFLDGLPTPCPHPGGSLGALGT